MTAPGSLRIGAKIPQIELRHDAADIRTYATTIERLGFHHLTSEDHVMGGEATWEGHSREVFPSTVSVHEVLTTFAYIAGIAPRLELCSGVMILPQRQTALVAKQAAEVDILSGGKLRLGVGLGWNRLEYTVLNESFGDRGIRLDEQIGLLRKLWTEPTVTFESAWHHIHGAGILPKPVQQPIPIWIGAAATPAIRRAARIADGFIPIGSFDTTIPGQIAVFRDELTRLGQAPGTVGLDGWIHLDRRNRGSWDREVSFWLDNRATHLTLLTEKMGYSSLEQHLDVLAEGLEMVRHGSG